MRVAAEGEAADPRVPAPASLRPLLGFSRLSAASYAVIQRAVEDDGIFRARVAEQADEAEVGRAGWLWLHRPVDWADDPVFTGGVLAGPDEGAGARTDKAAEREVKARTARFRKAAADAEAARKAASSAAAGLRAQVSALEAERDAQAAKAEAAEEARRVAVSKLKATESELADARRELKALRKQVRAASASASTADAGGRSGTKPPTAAGEPEVDRGALAAALAAALEDVDRLSRALADAAAVLDLAVPPSQMPAAGRVRGPAKAGPATGISATASPTKAGSDKASSAKAGRGQAGTKQRRGRRPRVLPALPPGIFDDTPEADRHLIASKANLLVVDGYNLARTAWSGIGTEEERRRTVALLEEVQARSGGRVVVVFDGDSATVAPRASGAVRVQFSASGQSADAAIAALIEATPPAQPIVVVSSDGEVASHARRHGAVALSSPAFLRAAGR